MWANCLSCDQRSRSNFEHRDLLCIQWIAFDLLQMHGNEPSFARAFDLCLYQLIRPMIHAAKDIRSGG